jgi:uncharacterized protein (DUF2147 family)
VKALKATVLICCWVLLAQQAMAEKIEGNWVLADGSAVVSLIVESETGAASAEVVSLLRPTFSVMDGYGVPGAPRTDINNPDKALRDRLVLGLKLASELRWDDGQWRGKIYDPGSGKTFRCNIRVVAPDLLEVRGHIGISLLGRTMYWQRLDRFNDQVNLMLGKVAAR